MGNQKDEELYKTYLNQIQRYFDSKDKSRNYLETKIALLAAQAGVVMSLILTLNNGIYKYYAIPIVFAIICYFIAFWPRKIWDNPSGDSLREIGIRINSGKIKTSEDINKELACCEPETREYLSDAFEKNNRLMKYLYFYVKLGMIFNVLGLVAWFLGILFPSFLIKW